MDRLEQFIVEQREDFNAAVPDLKVWGEIDRQLEQQHRSKGRVRTLRRVWRAAAAVAVLIIAGSLYFTNFNATSTTTSSSSVIAEVAPEYAEMEEYYHRQVSQKTEELVAVQHYDAVRADLQQLDQTMEDLKQELAQAPKGAEEQIVNAMLAAYEAKVSILERVLEKVKEEKPATLNKEKDEISI